jgi:hypothetical protein
LIGFAKGRVCVIPIAKAGKIFSKACPNRTDSPTMNDVRRSELIPLLYCEKEIIAFLVESFVDVRGRLVITPPDLIGSRACAGPACSSRP